MRYIKKGNPDFNLGKRHVSPPQSKDEATSAWSNYYASKARKTLERCLQEQLGLCGYSEIDLSERDLNIFNHLGVHIEHVEPKSLNPPRTFDHTNLIACAIDNENEKEIIKDDLFGGKFKLGWYEPIYFIHPLMPDCDSYFFFQSDGCIVPNINRSPIDQEKAQITIERLNLNSSILVVWRKNWYKETSEIIDGLLDDMEALKSFAYTELGLTSCLIRPFYSMLVQQFGNIGKQILL